jgi:hypothetical protein
MAYEEIKKELEDIAPGLGKIEKKHPFQAPANYFEELPTVVSDHVAVRRKKKSAGLEWLWRPQYAMVAAMLIAVLTISIFIFNRKTNTVPPQMVKNTNVPAASPANVAPTADAETLDNIVLENVDVETMQEALATKDKPAKTHKKVGSKDDKQMEEYILDHCDESNLIDAL